MRQRGPKLWAIVLAGGEGTRLASLTRALYGRALPKQFATLVGSRSMLQATIDRLLPMVPPERIIVVATRGGDAIARRQLEEWPDIDLVVQPRNLDTGPGLLLPLARLRARDRTARVVVIPSDHHVARPDDLLDTIARAVLCAGRRGPAVSLVGAAPESPDPDYGWIVCGRSIGRSGMRQVESFAEKPAPGRAAELMRSGALWNTFIMVGVAERIWKAARAMLPLHADWIEACEGESDVDRAYTELPAANFSRAVLERVAGLAVIPLRQSGWSDWGTPDRVFESLQGTPDHARLLARISRPAAAPALSAEA
jgi:mannose-1-phosphate guanylyltransferase